MLGVHRVTGGAGGVVPGTLGDPLFEQFHLPVEQGRFALGHGGPLASFGQYLIEQQTLLGMAGHDTGLVVVALLEEVGVGGHDIAALGLGGLVTALAVLLEEGADVMV